MKHFLCLVASLVIVHFLSACATMSADECAMADWSMIGYEDGLQGLRADTIAKHRKACAKHGVAPDLAGYESGHDRGLGVYCEPGNGFSEGSSGQSYGGVCLNYNEAAFLSAYQDGRQLYDMRRALQVVESSIHQKRDEVADLRAQISENERALQGVVSTAEQADLVAQIKTASERIGALELEIPLLIEERALRERDLRDYEYSLGVERYR